MLAVPPTATRAAAAAAAAPRGCGGAVAPARCSRPLPPHTSSSSSRSRRVTLTVAAASEASSSDATPSAALPTTATAVSATNGNGNGAAAAAAAQTSAPAPAPAVPPPLPASAVASLKLQLLAEVAGLDRGTLATLAQHARIAELLGSLEANSSSSAAAPLTGSPAAAEGRWQLLYTNTEVFRASPFFPAFASGLVRDPSLADAIFAFTDGIPGASIGPALQTLSLLSGALISEVQLSVFPGLTGTVVTSARASILSPTRLALDVQSTRVIDSTLSPLGLDAVAVPVEALVEAVAGPGATRVVYDISYCDSDLRVTRCGPQVMLHRRLD